MFTKSIILVLLGATLILASPVQESHEHRANRSILGTFAEWLYKADEAVNSVYDSVKRPFEKVFNAVIGAGEGVVDYSKEKVNQLLHKYYELKSKSEENLNEVKNAFLAKVIDELQTVINNLTKETDGETFEKLKQKTKELAESGKEALEKLQKQLQEAIDAEKKKLEENLEQWQQEADDTVKAKKKKH